MKDLTEIERIVGIYTSNERGPLLFVTTAVHGNEPSGVRALENIFTTLHSEKPAIKGTFVGVVGNKTALDNKVRYIDEDLNRTWTEKNIQNKIHDSNEKKEMFEIIAILEELNNQKHTHRYFVDCHTTSSESLPYISVQEVGRNDSWAHQFPIHITRGFSDIVEGTIDGYLSHQGITGFTVEAGQHESPESEAYHEGVIWIALKEACGLNFNKLESIPDAVLKTRNGTPPQKTFKITHRFGLKDDDDFEMEPGFKNFQPIQKGEHLATLNGKQINSVWNAFIFMPLYQAQGNDGFFVVEEVEA
jgi:succinylglutamate desuccinylase